MEAVWPWIGGAIVGAYLALLAIVLEQDRQRRRAERINALYWREDQIMAECLHQRQSCDDCGAALPPPATFPPITTGTSSITRWVA